MFKLLFLVFCSACCGQMHYGEPVPQLEVSARTYGQRVPTSYRVQPQQPRVPQETRNPTNRYPPKEDQPEVDNSTAALDEFLRSIGFDEEDEKPHATARDYSDADQFASQSYPQRVFVNPAMPLPLPVPAQSYPPASPEHQPTYKTLSLIKPFASKVSNKISGFLSIVLALLGGGGGSLSGFKDVLINGIIKPLFLVKGGLKVLIGKLSIPMISLLLINIEVLVTIWWLWEDCSPPPQYHPQPQTYTPVYNTNDYNPYSQPDRVKY